MEDYRCVCLNVTAVSFTPWCVGEAVIKPVIIPSESLKQNPLEKKKKDPPNLSVLISLLIPHPRFHLLHFTFDV